jgi:hypothetical protein
MVIEPPGDAERQGGRTTLRSGIAAWLAAGNPSRLLYGAVVSSAVLAVVDAQQETPSSVLTAVASVLLVYWLVHVYVEALARRVTTPARGTRLMLRTALRHEASILLGGIPGLVVPGMAFLFGASVATAISIAQWVTVALLAGAGHVGGYLAGRTGWRLVADTAFAALVGVLTILLKTLLHH